MLKDFQAEQRELLTQAEQRLQVIIDDDCGWSDWNVYIDDNKQEKPIYDRIYIV